jgi:hypothetical protein
MAVATATILAGRYQLGRLLGAGGMAQVYQGRDLLLARPVALKVLHPQLTRDPEFLARFWHEAQAAASVNHPNVVAVYDFGEHAGRSFLVLEHVPGTSLARVLAEQGPLPPERVARLGVQVSAALQAAHARRVIHRDVKPSNLLLGSDGVVKVTDFGIARAAEDTGDLTDPGKVLGSVHYMAPEQLTSGPVDRRIDLYALGVCLYELLTGHVPFEGDHPVAVAGGHLHTTPRPITEQRADVPAALAATIARALAKRPEDRQQSARQLRGELQRALAPPRQRPGGHPVPVRGPRVPVRGAARRRRVAPAWRGRRPVGLFGWLVALGCAMVLLVAASVLQTGPRPGAGTGRGSEAALPLPQGRAASGGQRPEAARSAPEAAVAASPTAPTVAAATRPSSTPRHTATTAGGTQLVQQDPDAAPGERRDRHVRPGNDDDARSRKRGGPGR